jgi:preprotein translocase subunit SecE
MSQTTSKEMKKTGETESSEPKKFQIAQIKQFAGEVRSEFEKIAWPDKKHTMASTGVVIVLVIMLSFYLGAVDMILGKLISYLLH